MNRLLVIFLALGGLGLVSKGAAAAPERYICFASGGTQQVDRTRPFVFDGRYDDLMRQWLHHIPALNLPPGRSGGCYPANERIGLDNNPYVTITTVSWVPAGGSAKKNQFKGLISGSDMSNADPRSSSALCERGGPNNTYNRFNNASCTLVESQGQHFDISPGRKVPTARRSRAVEDVVCRGGAEATFFPNGRIESCTVDPAATPTGAQTLTNESGQNVVCHGQVNFDPEGRVVTCD